MKISSSSYPTKGEYRTASNYEYPINDYEKGLLCNVLLKRRVEEEDYPANFLSSTFSPSNTA